MLTRRAIAGTLGRWDVGTLMNHMLETQRYFVGAAHGEDVAPPTSDPPNIMSDNPVTDFERARDDTIRAFGDPAVLEKTGPMLGIAFADQLLHAWDLAQCDGARRNDAKGVARGGIQHDPRPLLGPTANRRL